MILLKKKRNSLYSNKDIKLNLTMNKDVHVHSDFGQIGSCSPRWGFCLWGRWEHVQINMKEVLNMPAVCFGLDYCAYCVCMCVCVKVDV